ncbi:hypothetical protein [Nitrosomonas ureae]|uniref:hypothetical protein n=1 Tax=Nitrosomonas ureae TaxID=44577 RepID=UPI001143BCEA|nr:hypothetical protein [Nitrosomonas ureae]
MKTIELAECLGISRQLAYRHVTRGMPTENLVLAKEWRKRNLDITQTKQWRIDGNKGIKYSISKTNRDSKRINHVG